jgi:hypothetical protein
MPEVDVVPAVLVDGEQDLPHRFLVTRLGRSDVHVVGDVEPRPDLAPLRLHGVDPLLGRHPGRLGGALQLQPVLVGAGEVEDLLAARKVAGDEVGGDGAVGVPDVARRSGKIGVVM